MPALVGPPSSHRRPGGGRRTTRLVDRNRATSSWSQRRWRCRGPPPCGSPGRSRDRRRTVGHESMDGAVAPSTPSPPAKGTPRCRRSGPAPVNDRRHVRHWSYDSTTLTWAGGRPDAPAGDPGSAARSCPGRRLAARRRSGRNRHRRPPGGRRRPGRGGRRRTSRAARRGRRSWTTVSSLDRSAGSDPSSRASAFARQSIMAIRTPSVSRSASNGSARLRARRTAARARAARCPG